MLDQEKENVLWAFALKYYAVEGVATSLLELQDKNGLKINILIFAVWLTSINYRFNDVLNFDDIEDWHQKVSSKIRTPRKNIKSKLKNIEPENTELKALLNDNYQKILAAELAAEKVELLLLYNQYEKISRLNETNKRHESLIMENIMSYCIYEKDKNEMLLDVRVKQLIIGSLPFLKNENR